jgi:hypothetical protein
MRGAGAARPRAAVLAARRARGPASMLRPHPPHRPCAPQHRAAHLLPRGEPQRRVCRHGQGGRRRRGLGGAVLWQRRQPRPRGLHNPARLPPPPPRPPSAAQQGCHQGVLPRQQQARRGAARGLFNAGAAGLFVDGNSRLARSPPCNCPCPCPAPHRTPSPLTPPPPSPPHPQLLRHQPLQAARRRAALRLAAGGSGRPTGRPPAPARAPRARRCLVAPLPPAGPHARAARSLPPFPLTAPTRAPRARCPPSPCTCCTPPPH